MKYMLLLYVDEGACPDSEREACYLESAQIVHRLCTGEQLDTNPLYPVYTATSVRVRNGTRLLTDGPAAETREQLCGYFLVEAKGLDEAIELASQLPSAKKGTVEIRPIAQPSSLARKESGTVASGSAQLM